MAEPYTIKGYKPDDTIADCFWPWEHQDGTRHHAYADGWDSAFNTGKPLKQVSPGERLLQVAGAGPNG